MKLSRRNFIKTGTATSAFIPLLNSFSSEKQNISGEKFKIYFFTKLLDKYEPEFIAETLAMSGVDGFDLTVRPGGKIEPERVKEDLPKFVETGKKFKLETGMMVTGITGTDDKFTEDILQTASQLGIKHYRLGYYRYDYSIGILKTLESIKTHLKDLSVMNRQFNIQAGYQNHDGTGVGAAMWDWWELAKDFPVSTISTQFDIRHATVEANASWINALHLLSKTIGSLALKDFSWKIEKGKAKDVNVPLGEGMVDYKRFFKLIKELNINVPITLHIEYPLLDKNEEDLSLIAQQKIILRKIKKDVEFIKEMERIA